MHIASFAGIAPVNNPVIAVAVVIDDPKGASYYGAAVSAPVFAEVAQQVLEYLGVPHDTDLRAPKTSKSKPALTVAEDDDEHSGDINALFTAANDLPSDDPLRSGQLAQTQVAYQPVSQAPVSQPAGQSTAASSKSASGNKPGASQSASIPPASGAQQQSKTITVVEAKRLQVPSLLGLPVRKVIEQAAAAGLAVQITGNGTVREQAPSAGTMVLPGTQIVVRCGR
jgi:cell division protein FtsI (penicillin-binding protein 3)